MRQPLVRVELRGDGDLVRARQRTREVAARFGFDAGGQARIAAAVSEAARHALRNGPGALDLAVEGTPAQLVARVSDGGPGPSDAQAVLEGRGGEDSFGLAAAKRLMDRFELGERDGGGTVVTLAKALPRPPRAGELAQAAAALAGATDSPDGELRAQNRDLLRTLEELRSREAELQRRQDELRRLNAELEDTNRGVLALYAELDEKAESLRRAAELKSRFYSHISHEVRTPINAILNLSELALGDLGELPAEQLRPLQYIRQSARQLGELVNDLLDWAKVEAGRTEVHAAACDVGELFGALRGMFRPLHANEQVALVFEVPEDAPALRTDEGKLAQILRNLVSNALKFTERGEVRVSVRAAGGNVAFRVRDTGIGIAPEDQARLFEEFWQVANPLQRKVKGTGLGLAISRRLAELLGGWIRVESAPGEGSTFELVLPQHGPPGATPPADAAARSERMSARPRVLVIDDDEVARYLVRGALAELGCGVDEATDGPQGLAQARAEPPSAIVLDLSMPGLSGFDVLAALHADERTATVPVVVHTATGLNQADRDRLAGAVAILPKDGAGRDQSVARLRDALVKAGVLRVSPEY